MSVVLIGFAVLLTLVVLVRVPIAFAMGLVGFFGFAFLQGLDLANISDLRWTGVLSMATNRVVDTAQDYGLSVIPLFVLMGNLVTRSGLSHELYDASSAFLGHRKGGVSMATVVACGGFSAICGSSLATSATMAKVAMPPMRKYGYADSLATASIAAGGTLGILIPPSVILVIYGLLTESSIRELFAAGFIPGLLGVLFYLGAVRYTVWRNPKAGPAGERMSGRERLLAMRGVWGVLLLFIIVMGGIYLGIFTPTEAAGIGALIFSDFINRAGLPDMLLALVSGLDVAPLVVIFVILCIYIVLGMVFESLSMLLLTVPVFYPLVQSLGFDLVWFGIVVVVTEISLITPPVGMNVFVIGAVLRDVKTGTIFRGVTPFWFADIVRLALITLVPAISLWLPTLLYS